MNAANSVLCEQAREAGHGSRASLAGTIQIRMGSARALACPDRRPRRSEASVPKSLTGEEWKRSPIPRGRETKHAGRVCSAFLPNSHGLAAYCIALVLTLTAFGCTNISKSDSSTANQAKLMLQVSGDPGITVHVISSDGVDRVVTVPANLEFTSESFDLRCIHGPQPGWLRLVIVRDGLHLSTANTARPGEATVFRVRKGEVSAR